MFDQSNKCSSILSPCLRVYFSVCMCIQLRKRKNAYDRVRLQLDTERRRVAHRIQQFVLFQKY